MIKLSLFVLKCFFWNRIQSFRIDPCEHLWAFNLTSERPTVSLLCHTFEPTDILSSSHQSPWQHNKWHPLLGSLWADYILNKLTGEMRVGSSRKMNKMQQGGEWRTSEAGHPGRSQVSFGLHNAMTPPSLFTGTMTAAETETLDTWTLSSQLSSTGWTQNMAIL